MGDSLPTTLMNHCAQLDAAGFILGVEIRNEYDTIYLRALKSWRNG